MDIIVTVDILKCCVSYNLCNAGIRGFALSGFDILMTGEARVHAAAISSIHFIHQVRQCMLSAADQSFARPSVSGFDLAGDSKNTSITPRHVSTSKYPYHWCPIS